MLTQGSPCLREFLLTKTAGLALPSKMRILALETSGMAGEVALLENDLVIASQLLDPRQRTARSLAPGIAAILTYAGWTPRDVELVAVTIGPGSFTGLRIGVTTSKTFAYAVHCQAMGIDTLDVIAAQVPCASPAQPPLWVVLDAQRSQLFAARYDMDRQTWRRSRPTVIIDNQSFVANLEPGAWLAGAGLTRLRQPLSAPFTVVSESLWQPRAAIVGKLACREFQAGRRDDFWKMTPVYLRPSAAEEAIPSSAHVPDRET
jgi:tRNA threonylcarbamoyladenosine biosynthesis protein TsaB